MWDIHLITCFWRLDVHKKFYEIAGDRLSRSSSEAIQKARELSLEYLEKNHLVKIIEEEYQ